MNKGNVIWSDEIGWCGWVSAIAKNRTALIKALAVVTVHFNVECEDQGTHFRVGPFKLESKEKAIETVVDINNYYQYLANYPSEPLNYEAWKARCTEKLKGKKERKELERRKKHFTTYPSS